MSYHQHQQEYVVLSAYECTRAFFSVKIFFFSFLFHLICTETSAFSFWRLLGVESTFDYQCAFLKETVQDPRELVGRRKYVLTGNSWQRPQSTRSFLWVGKSHVVVSSKMLKKDKRQSHLTVTLACNLKLCFKMCFSCT